jgi:sugar phosphate isomerase/epimerase
VENTASYDCLTKTRDATFYTPDELRERLSISTYVYWKFRPIGIRALEELAAHGIRTIELLQSPEQFDMTDMRSMRFIRDACRACGIQVGAYHANQINFAGLDTETKRKERVDLCRRQIDTMLELGGDVWGSHAGEADATLFKCYQELARHVENTNARIAVENFVTPGKWIEDRMRFLKEMDHPHVGMILDTGHVRDSAGENPMTVPGGPTRVLELCAERLIHIHMHGFKEGRDHHPPFVEGDTIQWVELFRMLYAKEYAGHMNFEPSGEPIHRGSVQATGKAPERIVEMEAQAR